MNQLKQRLFTNWHFTRIFRLGIGIMLVAAGIQSHDWMMGVVSLFFLYQAVTDIGCCGSQGCYTPRPRKSIRSIENQK